METRSKKRITNDAEDDDTQQDHKRTKCSNNGGTIAMQTELVDAATHREVVSASNQRSLSPPAFNSSSNNDNILPLCQPCSPNVNNTTSSEALATDTSMSTTNNLADTTHGNNNHQSEVTSPPSASSALAAEAETSANNNGADLQPPPNHDHHSFEVEPASVAQFPPVNDNPSFDADELNEKFCKEFFVGRWFDSWQEALDEVQRWQNMHYNRVRKEGRQGAKCSCSGNSHSKAKESGEKVVSTKQFSKSTDCLMAIRWSKKKRDGDRVCITYVNGKHNHPCNLAYAAKVQKLSGRDIQSILPILAMPFAPYLEGGCKPTTAQARKLIKAHLGGGVQVDATSIATITAAVTQYVNSDKFEGIPQIDSRSMIAQFRKYITNDAATEGCSQILDRVLKNSCGETSWTVYQLLEELKRSDPDEFDYRIHKDSEGCIDAVCWQTGVHRAAFQLYGDIIFLDARKKDTMNALGLRYMTLVAIDGDNQFWPISHTFVFEEEHALYEFACKATLDMTPGRTNDSVKLGFGDLFFEQDRVKMWFPKILMMIDAYHLIYAKNGKSVMAQDFGPAVWNNLSNHFIKALEADDKDVFLVSVSSVLNLCWIDVCTVLTFC